MTERVPKAVAYAVLERAAQYCEKCGRPGLLVLHHRKLRSRGGKHTTANLIAVHPACHDLIHSYEDWSEIHGWIVPAGADHADIPVKVNPAPRPPL